MKYLEKLLLDQLLKAQFERMEIEKFREILNNEYNNKPCKRLIYNVKTKPI